MLYFFCLSCFRQSQYIIKVKNFNQAPLRLVNKVPVSLISLIRLVSVPGPMYWQLCMLLFKSYHWLPFFSFFIKRKGLVMDDNELKQEDRI